MPILLIGATGTVGTHVLSEALSLGHQVIALVRNPTALSAQENLTVVTGTPSSTSDVEKAFTALPGQLPSAVIVTLNNRSTTSPNLMHDAHANIIAAIKLHTSTAPSYAPKLVTLQAHGVGSSYASLSFAVKLLVKHSAMGITIKDHEAVEELVRGSGVRFVLARPTRLVDGEKMEVRMFGEEGVGISMMDKVTRKSVAAFLVRAAVEEEWDGKTPVFAN